MKDKVYILLGEKACNIFADEGPEGLIESGEDYEAKEYFAVDNTLKIIKEIIGSQDYFVITKEEYDLLK